MAASKSCFDSRLCTPFFPGVDFVVDMFLDRKGGVEELLDKEEDGVFLDVVRLEIDLRDSNRACRLNDASADRIAD